MEHRRRRPRLHVVALVIAGALAAACAPSSDGADAALVRSPSAAPDVPEPVPTTVAPPTSAAPVVPASGASPPSSAAPIEAPATTKPFIPRVVVDTGFQPYAMVGPVTLHHPAAQVERIGFHESGHDGAQQQEAATGAARAFVMETRNRGTGDRTAADIVVVPDAEIRSPVTGTVKRGGTYTLYCDHRDQYFVVDPDERPGWEVKIFHIEGLQVQAGQRVEAGVTVVAARSRILPFESQVDEATAEPSWPHVHVEVIDPSIPDKPNPGGGGGCP